MNRAISWGCITKKANRNGKGESRLQLVSDYVVVDLETTGLDPVRDDIIEIGSIRVTGGEIADSFSVLVSPGYEIGGFITQLTGITNDMLAGAPDIRTVLPAFLDFAGDSMIIGHNVNFDINFLYSNCVSVLGQPFSNDFIDTMRLSRRLFPQHGHHRLCDLIRRFEIGDAVGHRALADVMQTNRCYEYMKRYISDKGIGLDALLTRGKGRQKA
jgi:DNA polymerase-3 subunit epsilon